MSKKSCIEWTHHTFNPWWGCEKVSEACRNCYAEAFARRLGHNVWGRTSVRRPASPAYWEQPHKWNREAERAHVRQRVFCASMADVFEDRRDLDSHRERLWKLIADTPSLDWLLLTKRPEQVHNLVPWKAEWPHNVWIGTTVENQQCADERLPHLARLPAARRFISCEPLLEKLEISSWLKPCSQTLYPINWVIAGGESGPKARPMLPTWAMSLRDTCVSEEVPFFFKQWGCWIPVENNVDGRAQTVLDAETMQPFLMRRVTKVLAGRELDGRVWNEIPASFPLSVCAADPQEPALIRAPGTPVN